MALSRWGLAWRAGLAVGIVGVPVLAVTGMLVYGASEEGVPSSELMQSLWIVLFASAAAGVLAAAVGPRLRRYYPFTQALLFGGLVIAGMFVIVLVLGIVEDLGRICEPDALCTPQTVSLPSYFALLFGFPIFLAAALGYGVAIWAANRFPARRPATVR